MIFEIDWLTTFIIGLFFGFLIGLLTGLYIRHRSKNFLVAVQTIIVFLTLFFLGFQIIYGDGVDFELYLLAGLTVGFTFGSDPIEVLQIFLRKEKGDTKNKKDGNK